MSMKIVVGIDGSEPSARAVEWCARNAGPLGAEVIAVHAIDSPILVTPMAAEIALPQFTEIDRERIRETATVKWCAPLESAGVSFRCRVARRFREPAPSWTPPRPRTPTS